MKIPSLNFHFRISRFSSLSKRHTRKAICMRSVKAPARVRSTGHVENFKTTISPVKECYLSSNLHIHFPVTPKKLTVSPFTFFGSRNRAAIYHGGGKGAETTLFPNNVLSYYRSCPSFPRNGLCEKRYIYISLSSVENVQRVMIKRGGDM